MEQLTAERKKQLALISQLRGNRDVLVVAADLNKIEAPIAINYSDLLAVNDQLSVLKGDAVDLLLETPGGSGRGCRRHSSASASKVPRGGSDCSGLREERGHDHRDGGRRDTDGTFGDRLRRCLRRMLYNSGDDYG